MTLPSPMECAASAMFCAAMPQSICENFVGASMGVEMNTTVGAAKKRMSRPGSALCRAL